MNNNKFSTLKNISNQAPILNELQSSKYNTNLFSTNEKSKSGGLRYKNFFKRHINSKPLISVITVVFNGEKNLEKTIKSVLNQSYDNIEYIIIDGDSSDNTLNIIKKYSDFIDFWLSEKDTGIYNAMNKGLTYCTGDYVGILNSGDIYTKYALSFIKKYINNENPDFIFGSVYKDRILSGYNPQKINWKFNIYPAHSSGFFIKSSSQKIVGKYNEKYKFHSDYDLMYRIIVRHKLKGITTKKKHLIGIFDIFGVSSKESFTSYLLEELNIRLDNKQNLFQVYFFFIIRFLYFLIIKISFIRNKITFIKKKFRLNF